MSRYYNTELAPEEADLLKMYCKNNGIDFETCGCFGLIHFEILATLEEAIAIESFLYDNNVFDFVIYD